MRPQPEQKPHARLRVGTSGYSYPEWVAGGFYPAGLKAAAMLAWYAQRFSVTELNYTWYQMPKAEAVERQRRQAPPGFLFAAKLTRTMTHEIGGDWKEQARRYRDGIAPLLQARQLAAVLVQLAPNFDYAPKNRRHLAELLDALEGLPRVVEFRHDSWAQDRVFAELERRRVTLAAVDEPKLPGLFPALDVVTNPAGCYVRFHGRNAAGWRSGTTAQKFNYDYSDAELAEWLDTKIAALLRRAERGFVFFNNHYGALAPKNARSFIQLAQRRGLEAG